jgi:hypothetical protein
MANDWALGKFAGEFGQGMQTWVCPDLDINGTDPSSD